MSNKGPAAAATPLHAFYAHEENHPDQPWLLQPDVAGNVQTLTWAEVGRQARAMAGYLLEMGLSDRAHIGLLAKNSAHWFVADLAIWMAGYISVPVHPNLDAEAMAEIIRQGDVQVLFVGEINEWASISQALPAGIPRIGLPTASEDGCLRAWASIVDSATPVAGSPVPDPQQTATVIFTSGTTGVYKGVMLSFANLAFVGRNNLRLFNITADDRLFSFLSLSHIYERQVMEITSMIAGIRVHFAARGCTFMRDLKQARPTLLFVVPRILDVLRQGVEKKVSPGVLRTLMRIPFLRHRVAGRILRRLGMADVRYLVSGGAPASIGLIQFFRQLGVGVAEGYGLTENVGYSHLGRPKRYRPGWVGLPNPGVECRLSDEGELLVRSPAVMQGYYKNPQKTAAALDADGFLHTGDLVEMDHEGFLRVLGRIQDALVTSESQRVMPVPIELRIQEHPLIDQACILGNNLPLPLALLRLKAPVQDRLINNREQIERELSGLLEEINQSLPRRSRLSCLVVVSDPWRIEQGYLTPTLKLRRSVIEAAYASRLSIWSVSGRPVVWAGHNNE
ncbi:AMP-binding protein [Halopseudomonas salegens]|uniref:Long-chain acyl-CoA synthetase (AMP-forming) n=1 Tax=Halopseudomonas salegens TaxID=1434072 RepID=A0A1H2FRY5_9GAMM|nr:AMP-binding protein [Halopseudomonas salegens]SDU10086.1 Long-chain acyl-CoA synthetase (AMP-forming) [Halopseudomonas salegens]